MTSDILTWLIPVPPLLAFFLIVLFTNKDKVLSHAIALVGIGLSWIWSWSIFFRVLGLEHFGEEIIENALPWLPVGTESLSMGVLVDPLTAVMLFFVSLACLMIFIYSVGYSNFGKPRDPHDQPGQPPHNGIEPLYSRFFAFGMLTLVVADNVLLMFIGWEIMGLCSYLLIGFWYARDYPDPKQITPRRAAVKAFMTTRVGDVLMLLGIVYLYFQTGTLSFREILYANGGQVVSMLAGLDSFIPGLKVAGLIGLLLFAGTVGKSAQFPLHVWLPDAMEGPTPVSAMIHAATMVSAGVYAMVRLFPLLSAGWHHGEVLTPPMLAMAAIGAFTALFAATIAVAQNDVKKVLAYSTISQLGYMIAALGIGAYIAAAFHLVTHAFFKALLFLGSGSVIHGVEHGQHASHEASHPAKQDASGEAHGYDQQHNQQSQRDFQSAISNQQSFDPQNMLNMGGLRQKMPITFWTFLIGGLALSGFPLVTAGFWSKDAILGGAWEGEHFIVFAVLAVAAFLTAFYTMRQISLTFLGEPRSQAAEHAQENVWTMTLPLVILAFFAVTAGWVGIPNDFLGMDLGHINWFHEFVGGTLIEHPAEEVFHIIPLATSLVVALGGLALGWLVYRSLPAGAEDPLQRALGPIHTLLKNKYYFDELYDFLFVRPVRWLSEVLVSAWMDKGLIDGLLHWIGRTSLRVGDAFRNYFDAPVVNGAGDLVGEGVKKFGHSFRVIQTGKVQYYLLVTMAAVIAFGGVFLIFTR